MLTNSMSVDVSCIRLEHKKFLLYAYVVCQEHSNLRSNPYLKPVKVGQSKQIVITIICAILSVYNKI